ncbi:hypothetical protein G3480_04760 [Thiorhodococcus mannitoliphagus]|uniref:Uncharacterized protein n=1 Tax=Thiorhodococcus mannitoliphagus TaxID=329406 RepID=A0A6P1DNW8_9GAMM|nr:hypothetical protein [Thiorhodococcus mannitoliphagus]NEX19629.1 hypothetical protein [Thiorhodococcus mannitoliphagus]
MASSNCIYGHKPERTRQSLLDSCLPSWSSLLTPEWRGRVITPGAFRVHHEHEMAAKRVLGYDSRGQPCFYAHDYRQMDVRSDDDEDFYQALAYSESITAWRLRSGLWLVHRRVEPLGEEGESGSSFGLEARMPG